MAEFHIAASDSGSYVCWLNVAMCPKSIKHQSNCDYIQQNELCPKSMLQYIPILSRFHAKLSVCKLKNMFIEYAVDVSVLPQCNAQKKWRSSSQLKEIKIVDGGHTDPVPIENKK